MQVTDADHSMCRKKMCRKILRQVDFHNNMLIHTHRKAVTVWTIPRLFLTESADTETFGSGHELHFQLLRAAQHKLPLT